MAEKSETNLKRSDILRQVHKDIDYFRRRWQEFGEAVEKAGEILKDYASKPEQKKIREERAYTPEYYELDKEYHDADRKYKKYKTAQDDREAERWRKLATQKKGARRTLAKRLLLQKQFAPESPWANWISYYLDQLSCMSPKLFQTEFYVPPDTLTYMYSAGVVLPKDGNEDFLLDCAVLCVAYDHWIDVDKPHLYYHGSYKGEYFYCDACAERLWEKASGDDRICLAWQNVKAAFIAAKPPKTGRGKANVKYAGFEDFLANNVMYRVSSLIAAYPKANLVFKKHIEKVVTASAKYGGWLRAEYKNAEKRGLTDRGKRPDGKDWQLITCADWNWEDVFFETAEIQRHFWMKKKPKPNPLDYLRSIVWGKIGKLPRGISLLDYQYFMVACIYDSQCRPEQRRIYFSPEPEDSAVWDKQLKDRICRRVWLVLVKGQRDIFAQVEITEEKIKTALRSIEADLTGGSKFTEDVPVLNEDQLKVLDYLNKEYPQIRYGTDIEAATDISRKTVGLYLKTLKLYELVCPPEGKKKGYVITPSGKNYLGKHFS